MCGTNTGYESVYGVRRCSTTGYVLIMAEVVSCLVSSELKPMRVRMIIVGADFVGLAAARRLAEDSRFSVTILEASGRVGGQARSASFPDHGSFVQDLGCTWFYRTVREGANNFIYRHVLESDLLTCARE